MKDSEFFALTWVVLLIILGVIIAINAEVECAEHPCPPHHRPAWVAGGCACVGK